MSSPAASSSSSSYTATMNGRAAAPTGNHHDDVVAGAPGTIVAYDDDAAEASILNQAAKHHHHHGNDGTSKSTTTDRDAAINDNDLGDAEKKQQAQISNNYHDLLELDSWSSHDGDLSVNSENRYINFDTKNDDHVVAEAEEEGESDIVEYVAVGEDQRNEQQIIQQQQQQYHQLRLQPTSNTIDSNLAAITNIAYPQYMTTATTAPSMTSSATSTNTTIAAAMATFHARNQHMPQSMRMMSTPQGGNDVHAVNNDPRNYHHHRGGISSSRTTKDEAAGATASASAYSDTSSSSSLFHHHNHHSNHQPGVASISYHHPWPPQQQQRQHLPPSAEEIEIPKSHTPTWSNILPKSCCVHYQHRQQLQQRQQPRKKLTLSLINVWEFTITVEPLSFFPSSYHCYGSTTSTTTTTTTTINPTDSTNGLRAQIKRIAREHTGRDGRRGAIFERSGNIGGEEDPMWKESMMSSATLPGLQPQQQQQMQPSHLLGDGNAQGKWRIPLGAYQSLLSYLATCSQNYVVEDIPPEQLRVATLGRERMDKKSYPDASELISRNVSPTVCAALAPYQRGGVEFILDREGCALLADEMGLGKTLMAIGSMSAYRESDWPLLVLCPSSARYHWEMEFRHWMGVESRTMMGGSHAMDEESNGKLSSSTTASAAVEAMMQAAMDDDNSILMNEQINVLTSGRDVILNRNGSTRVVICSIGLIVNLANSNRIYPGMFQAIIVDESHALKSESSKRTMAVLPLLKAARRCLLLSGTPALARPAELWPQLSVLRSRGNRTYTWGGRVGDSNPSSSLGLWCNEQEFMSKYVKGKGEEGKMTRLAELHTLLTSTVMIRRMKADILKNMPPKLREKAYINIEDETMRSDFRIHMELLRRGQGVLGKLARKHCNREGDTEQKQSHIRAGENGAMYQKDVLHHLYKISGQSKVPRIAKMLKRYLSDPANGKVCIFAHHLDVLDSIGKGAGLSNSLGSTTRYIRIDGSTSPKARQEQILNFQTNPAIRVALLGITAAGVAVTLTASSTVWFAELFWTPAIMIQAEDRCHRIGQQARVRCLYFIARETLDEILWKLIEQKFREIGEFVDGKENMGIALERELEDGEDEAILKLDDKDEVTKKRKSHNMLSEELLDSDDLELKIEIEELRHEEEDMFNLKNEEDEDELDNDEKATPDSSNIMTTPGGIAAHTKTTPSETVIELSDEDDDSLTISQIRERHLESGALGTPSIGPQVQFDNLRIYNVNYPGPSYGITMTQCHGRIIVKSCHLRSNLNLPSIGAILVGVNGVLIPFRVSLEKVISFMRSMMQSPPVSIMYAEDDEFISFFNDVFVPNIMPQHPATATAATRRDPEVIDLCRDD